MPRARKPRNITLYLPSPGPSSADAPSPVVPVPTQTPGAAPPSLDVLLMAQQIAHSRGHTFDIDSFLAPDQREEYLSILARGEEENENEDASHAGSSRIPGVAGSRAGSGSRSRSASEFRSRSNSASASLSVGLRADDLFNLGDLDSDLEPEPEPEPTDTPAARNRLDTPEEDRPAKRARLAQHASPLAQAYWRQRLVRMTSQGERGRSATRSMTPRLGIKNEPDDPATPASALAAPSPPFTPPPAHRRGEQPPAPLTVEEKADIQSSASYWNHLLIQARASRGPQWDYNTQQLQFDRCSLDYYCQGQEPRASPSPPASPSKPLPAESMPASGSASLPNGSGPGEAHDPPTPGRSSSSSSSARVGAGIPASSPVTVAGTPLAVPPRLPPSPATGPGQSPAPLQRPLAQRTPSLPAAPLPGQLTPGQQGGQAPGPGQAQAIQQQQAQAHVQAQALALGAGQGFMNPSVMLGGGGGGPGGPGGPGQPPGGPPRPMIPAGINPLALMGGGMMPQNGPPGQFGAGPGPGPMLAGGGGWGEGGFSN